MSGYAVMKDGDNVIACRSVDGPETMSSDEVFWPFENGPPPAPSLTVSDIKAQCDKLLTLAALRIAPLQDAVDLGSATAANVASLKLWKEYRVELSNVTEQTGFPVAVEWPVAPA